jgi:hypothetical protein
MTLKQFAIWREIQQYRQRGKLLTLGRIAETVGCSRATVSRFLRRLDLWRFIDCFSLRGRGGGVIIMTRRDPFVEEDAMASGARITRKTRNRARARMAREFKKAAMERIAPLLAKYRIPRVAWWKLSMDQFGMDGSELPLPAPKSRRRSGGRTGATFIPNRGFGVA